MSTRMLIVALIALVVLLVPVAFLIGRRQAAPPPAAPVATAPVAEAPPSEGASLAAAPDEPAPAPAPAAEVDKPPVKAGTDDLFSGLVAAVGNRVADDARRAMDKAVDRVVDDVSKEVATRVDDATAKLERELGERLSKGRGESERAARKLGEDLDQRSAALTRATTEQSERLDEQVEAIAKAGRASAEAIGKTATDLRTLVSGTVTSFNADADKAKARLLTLVKEGKGRVQALAGKSGLALPGAERISNDLAAIWQRCFGEVDAAQAALQQRTAAAHQRFTEAVAKAQAEAEQQRLKALALVQGAGETLRDQVTGAQRELTEAVKRAHGEADQSLAKTMSKAEPGTAAKPEAPRRGTR